MQDALSARRSAVRELAVTRSTRAKALVNEWKPRLRHHARDVRDQTIALAREWWPRVHHQAHDVRVRWLSLESATGPLLAVASVSVVVAYLIVAFG